MSEVVEKFVIDSDQKAEWALQKVREARADRDRWVEFYKDQIEKVKYECDQNVENLEYMLRQYFETVPHKTTKTQESYALPGGKLLLKRQDYEYEHDDNTLVPWLEKNAPEFVKIKKSSDWDGLKKKVAVFDGNVVDENGEVVPGVTATERPDKFAIELKKE